MAIICFLSFSSIEDVPNFKIKGIDKLAHFGMYFILALLSIIQIKKKELTVFRVILFAVLLAALTELIQHYFIVNRKGDWVDFLANLVGLGSGIFLMQNKIKN